jgi:hypothetical protein
MNRFDKKSVIFILLFGIMFAGCKSSKTTASRYVGEWHYTFEMEGTDYAAVMTINKNENGYTGTLSSELGSVDLDNLIIEDAKLKASYDIQ